MRAAGVAVSDIKEVFGAIANEAVQIIRSNTPVRTGRLRKSIRGSKQIKKALVRAGGKRVPYAAPINYGWRVRRINPQEFLQSADETMEKRAPEMLDEGLTRILAKVGATK